MAKEDEQRLKDMMRAIELGEIEEDILEGDQEEYEDMGGINSLKKGAPSIKLASETGPEEFELELMSIIREFNDRMQNGELDPSTTVEEYINDYLSRKKMMMEDKNRQMAMYGGRMQYGDGTDLRNKMSKLMIKAANGTITDKEMIELRNMESAGMFSRANNAYGGRMQYESGSDRPYEMKDGQKKYINLPEKGYSNPFDARRAGDLEDRARYREIQSVKDKKGKAKPFTMNPEKLKQLIEKAKQEKEQLAKGGIAGVL